MVKGKPVFVCCQGCVDQVRENPDKFLEKLDKATREKPAGKDRSASALHRH
jgi:hypothetical protein